MRALLVRAGALGDLLLLRRAVHALRRQDISVTLLAPSEPASAMVGLGLSEAQAVLAWERADVAALMSPDGLGAGPLRDELARCNMAVVYSRSQPLARNLGAVIEVVAVHDPAPGNGRHASWWLCDPLAPYGFDPEGEPPPLCATVAEEQSARPWLDRLPPGFLAIHPGSGSPVKNWPAESFAQTVAALSPSAPWLLVAGPAETAVAGLGDLPGAVLARQLAPRVLGAVLARAGLYIGNDSGVSHLAAACGAPTLAVFGPTDPTLWAPVGPSVRTLRAPSGAIAGLPVTEVLEAAGRMTRAPSP